MAADTDLVPVCAGEGRRGGPAAGRLLDEVLVRRSWALHRHVHLVRAFEEAAADERIRHALSIGCGAGLSELFLAARHPRVRFTLTDFDERRLDIGRRRARDLKLRNVSFGSLDLLADVDGRRFDWVSSIEVLEHIDDDARAARNLVARSRGWFWILVPQCPAEDLTDPAVIERAWTQFEHHRPGYTPDTLAAVLGPAAEIRWMRTCYRTPAAVELWRELRDATDDELVERRGELVALACADLDGPADAPGLGIEVLGRVRA